MRGALACALLLLGVAGCGASKDAGSDAAAPRANASDTTPTPTPTPTEAVAAPAALAEFTGRKGVWRGTIGTLPVIACLNGDEGNAGAYYYQSKLRPIGLHDTDNAAQFAEIGEDESATGPIWSLKAEGEGKIAGEWRQGRKSLPIVLTRTPSLRRAEQSPCETAGFMQPRFGGWSVRRTPASFEGTAYTRLDWVPGKAFARDTISQASFAIAETRPGDRAINRALAAILPGDDPAHEAYGCVASSVSNRGRDGYWEAAAVPELLARDWIGVQEAGNYYCGGMHPDRLELHRVFDRRNGKEVDPARFLKPGSLTFYDIPPGITAAKRQIDDLSPALLKLALKHWQAAGGDCKEAFTLGGYDIGIATEGLVITPQLPSVAAACADPSIVPWKELPPFLSVEGKVVAASLTR